MMPPKKAPGEAAGKIPQRLLFTDPLGGGGAPIAQCGGGKEGEAAPNPPP